MNGKKRNLHRGDFLKFADTCGIPRKAAERLIDKVIRSEENFIEECRDSYLPDELKTNLSDLIRTRTNDLRKNPADPLRKK